MCGLDDRKVSGLFGMVVSGEVCGDGSVICDGIVIGDWLWCLGDDLLGCLLDLRVVYLVILIVYCNVWCLMWLVVKVVDILLVVVFLNEVFFGLFVDLCVCIVLCVCLYWCEVLFCVWSVFCVFCFVFGCICWFWFVEFWLFVFKGGCWCVCGGFCDVGGWFDRWLVLCVLLVFVV